MTTYCDTTTLLKAVEVWRPTPDGAQLQCSCHSLEARGPLGLEDNDPVSLAWSNRTPVIGDAPPSEHGPAVVLALPAYRGDACRGVLALQFSNAIEGQGAIEVWRRNERNELARDEAWYHGLKRFAAISRCVKFPRRAGLPGKVWADRFPRVLGSLGSSSSFVRAAGARAEGLATALGVPFMSNALELESVLLLLCSRGAPLFRAVEVWAREPGGKELTIVSADYGPYVDLAPISRRRRLHLGEGIAGHVYRDQQPWMTSDLVGAEFPRGELFAQYGFSVGAGFPVFVGEQLVAAVSLLA